MRFYKIIIIRLFKKEIKDKFNTEKCKEIKHAL